MVTYFCFWKCLQLALLLFSARCVGSRIQNWYYVKTLSLGTIKMLFHCMSPLLLLTRNLLSVCLLCLYRWYAFSFLLLLRLCFLCSEISPWFLKVIYFVLLLESRHAASSWRLMFSFSSEKGLTIFCMITAPFSFYILSQYVIPIRCILDPFL